MNETNQTPVEREAQINAANARMNAAIAQDAARHARADSYKAAERNALGSWLVAGSAAFAGLIGLGIWANSVNNATGTASSASQPPVVIERKVTASPAQSPIIVREYVPVPVLGVPVQPTPAPAPMNGYTEPSPIPAPSLAAPTPPVTPVPPATPSDPNAPLGGYIER